MKTSKSTILITGGSAGIGLEIAKLFDSKDNRVIITGRDKNRLIEAVAQLKNGAYIVSDSSVENDIISLAETINADYPELDILINNAGSAFVYDLFGDGNNAADLAWTEMLTNYFSIVRLTERLLPLLKQQPEAAIVNVSSVVAFVPGKRLPGYAASKAALHSYTQSLRLALAEKSGIKVFELMPPLVNTNFSKDIGGERGMSPEDVATALLEAVENDCYEIRVGQTENLYQLYLSSPEKALAAMNPTK
ncbi:SDR family oxidoreductase [Mucilaginibacter polytrichastri]|uniref:Oxidoreductase DltE n=1 Tax=Mucilaginibacter polytrichastri TaxID=1302689 RepID=A0A1Q5ZY51_9SPHI|nr:SDR family NAD(P)-dependent oxidoreductase [Mucilaginibacter polytrichastri]OKS86690.1 hypothetical protein RG47T_2147 [Mucilaginibacter polytrichastri]SFS82212.1 uncharacterized oxidoreductase [Mucilaginibacter polytrichastri]